MPPHRNHTFRTQDDLHAAYIAMASMLKALTEKLDVNPDRVRQFVEAATEDDRKIVARAQWHVDWMLGQINSEGDRA